MSGRRWKQQATGSGAMCQGGLKELAPDQVLHEGTGWVVTEMGCLSNGG